MREAGGVEIFAIGKLDDEGRVYDLEVHCRGQEGAVPALLHRPRPGEVVIHNHPSGVLRASDADMALAARYGEDGVGVVIVNNEVTAAQWVVEPHRPKRVEVDEAEVRAFFAELLPSALPGWEARPGQVDMALAVTRALNQDEVAVLEAGTGTGKSLAYLVPAALWATKNDGRVAVATYTITLQGQLVTSDIPVMRTAGLEFKHALLKGRTNYLCRRRHAEALAGARARADDEASTLRALEDWATVSADGSRSDLPFPVEESLWEQVLSDHDQTLRVRCPYYSSCFYYEARRKAASAHVLVVNHHLLLSDLAVKAETGGEAGLLPRYDRLVLDEAHHLEDAATSLYQERLSARAISRALWPLLDREKRPGALSRLAAFHAAEDAPLSREARAAVDATLPLLQRSIPPLRTSSRARLEAVADAVLSVDTPAQRVTAELEAGPAWSQTVLPSLEQLAGDLHDAAEHLGKLEEALGELPEAIVLKEPQPVFDLGRARRRVGEMAGLADAFRLEAPGLQSAGVVRWVEEARERGAAPSAALCRAPVEVGAALRSQVFDAMKTSVLTSATMTVGGRFEHLCERLGLGTHPGLFTQQFPSPFDYKSQALLGLPRDLPEPDDAAFEEAAARFITEALRVTGGGAFVLCTSFALLRALHARVKPALEGQMLFLRQGDVGRDQLLQRFRESPSAVLFGTDSFWEGVSVAGDALRLVIIPRLPFRVPTEPVQQARHERIAAAGQDPFRAYSLPQAVLRFRQGFGRLIRTQSDRGAVIVLDRRVIGRWYGQVFLASLPELDRAVGPSRAVLDRLRAFYGARVAKSP